MTTQLKLSLGLAGAFALVVAVLLTLTAMSGDDADAGGDVSSRLVRDDSHVLGAEGDTGVTLVEFLDFECAACRSVHPAVELLREDYEGRVTFVVRYFPMPGHVNGERAARAVEAAAQQGRFEEMYDRMFETQAEWGGQQTPHDALFRSYAEDLGLDMERFDADYADRATTTRIAKDIADGTALDVEGTPTFFVDGERLQPRTYDDLTEALDAALAD